MKKAFLAVLMFVMGIAFLLPAMNHANAQTDGEITWGKVMTGVYDNLHPYTLNWSGNVLDKGGLNLTSMKVTGNHEADLVINQYGAIGASRILKLDGEQLEVPTYLTQSGFQSSYTLAQGDIYLIVLHDGKYAKIRIDRVLPGKVFFSYVLEANSNTAPAANPSATNPAGAGQTTQVPPAPVQTFPAALFGTWNIYFLSTSQPAEAVGGLTINPNGTYTQKKKNAGEVTGTWRTANPKEVNGYTEAILLQNGLEKTDWAVVPQGNGKILLLQKSVASSGPLYGNTVHTVWLPLYEGTKLSADSAPIAPIKATNYDYSVFQGKWSLWVQGGAANLYYKDTGNYATHQYDPGAGGGSLMVNADGTYTMNSSEKASGKWRPSKMNEVYGYDWSIILEKGPGGIDWAVLMNNNGKTMVAYDTGGKWTDGSKMWAPYYIADRIE